MTEIQCYAGCNQGHEQEEDNLFFAVIACRAAGIALQAQHGIVQVLPVDAAFSINKGSHQ